MAINPLITMGVKPIDLDFSDRRARNAQADLIKQQTEQRRLDLEQEKATMDALKQFGNDITPETIKQVSLRDPKTGMVMQNLYSKQQADAIAAQEAGFKAQEAQYKAKSADYKMKSEQLAKWANLASGITDEQSYYQALKFGVDEGLDISLVRGMAEGGYDPVKVQQFAKQMLTAKERVELDDLLDKKEFEAKKRPLDLKKAEGEAVNVTRDPVTGRTPGDVVLDQRSEGQRLFEAKKAEEDRKFREAEAEKQRKFQAGENAQNRSVQVSGQNMVDARTRELAEATRGNKPLTEPENRNFGFYDRGRQAQQALDAVEAEIADKGYLGQAAMKVLPNVLQSDTNQSFQQARRQFTEAYLRRDSGAAISPSEYENADKTFFVQAGDGPKVIEQKRKARETVINSLKVGAGRAIEKYEGVQSQPGGAKPTGGNKEDLRKKYNY